MKEIIFGIFVILFIFFLIEEGINKIKKLKMELFVKSESVVDELAILLVSFVIFIFSDNFFCFGFSFGLLKFTFLKLSLKILADFFLVLSEGVLKFFFLLLS